MILPDLIDQLAGSRQNGHDDVAGVFSMTDSIREQGSRLLRSAEDFIGSPVVNPSGMKDPLPPPWGDSVLPSEAWPFEDYIDGLISWLLPHSVNVRSPRCLANMSSVVPAFLRPIGELVQALNQNLVKAEASKGLSLIERQTIAMLHRAMYDLPAPFYQKEAEDREATLGIGASCGSLANLTALWLARNAALAGTHSERDAAQPEISNALDRLGKIGTAVIVSELAHYSIDKAADLLGLRDGLIKLPVDANHRLDLAALRDAVEDCQRAKKKIIAVIGLAGSTECGSIDPLGSIAAIARSAGAHFHVDAAWGAPLALSAAHRHKVAGIELSDSVTVDAHKQFYAPVGSSFLLLRDPQAAKVIEQDARYLFHSGARDLGKRSLEGSRPGSSLFLHAALHVLGRDKLSELIVRGHENARFMAELIRKSDEFELLCEPDTNIVVYRFLPEQWRAPEKRHAVSGADAGAINRFNAGLQRAQSEAGRGMVSRTTLFPNSAPSREPVVALRAVLSNPLTGYEDLKFILEDQLKVAAEMIGGGR